MCMTTAQRVARQGRDLVYPTGSDWQAGETRLFDLIDPATECCWARLPMADAADVDQAVAKAKAFSHSLYLGQVDHDPLGILARLIEEISARREEFATVISREMGAPIDFARSKQVDAAIGHLQVILAEATAAAQEVLTHPPAHAVRYEALGVAALITPWNWPLNQVALKVGAALAAGCTMILKPSEHGALSAMLFADCMAAAGAPDGLFSVLIGDGAVGEMLVQQAEVDVISFTGSTEVGRQIAATAGRNLTPVLLELGGKSANILLQDCDVETAVKQGVAHCFRNAGQSCNAASRMLVARPIYESVVTRAAAEAAEYIFADPKASGPHQGPLVNRAQWDHVQRCIQNAVTDGARLVAGGAGRFDPLQVGYFPKPTVFADVTPKMRLFREEVFGPVLSITPFDDIDHAIALANASAYGLAAYVQSSDGKAAASVARQLAVGMVQINGNSRAAGAPFGGRKASGYGREAGLWGVRAFQTVKSVSGL